MTDPGSSYNISIRNHNKTITSLSLKNSRFPKIELVDRTKMQLNQHCFIFYWTQTLRRNCLAKGHQPPLITYSADVWNWNDFFLNWIKTICPIAQQCRCREGLFCQSCDFIYTMGVLLIMIIIVYQVSGVLRSS